MRLRPLARSPFLGAVLVALVLFFFRPDPKEAPVPSSPPAPVGTLLSDDLAQVAERATLGVVGVVNLSRAPGLWERNPQPVPVGTGSGILFSEKDGSLYVATNHHVVAGAEEIDVVLSDGQRRKARLVGADPPSDLAVLVFPKPDVAYALLLFGDSTRLRAGEPALAIGNPLGLLYFRSVTAGVISAPKRTIPYDLSGDGKVDWELDVIQTDAAINPGNSGGPLLNRAGEVVGITSAKITAVGVEGIEFAIPIHVAKPILESLARGERVVRPYLGVQPKNTWEIPAEQRAHTLCLPEEPARGVVLVDVLPGGPTDAAGLRPLDVIVAVDGVPVNDAVDLRAVLYSRHRPGERVRIEFLRGEERSEAEVELGSMDAGKAKQE